MTIKEYRRGKGMTQAELASAVGVPQNNVSRWESGAVNPGVETLRKLADVFGCQMDDITPAVRQLKARDIFTREAYQYSTPAERRRELKKQQAAEYSGWRRYPTTMSRPMERIPADWWDTYTAQHIGEVMAMLNTAFDDGRNYGLEHPDY